MASSRVTIRIPALACHPLARAVLVQHHAFPRTARPLAPVGTPPWCRRHPAVCLQGQPNPVVAEREAVPGDQLLVKVLRREIEVMRIEQRQYPRDFVHRRPAHRDLAETSVIQPLGTIRLEPNPPAPERPLRNTQNLRRLRLAQIATTAPPVNPFELHQAQPLELLRPSHHRSLLRAVLKPDRSSVPYAGHIPC